jgi:hypothetical protein
VTGNDRFSLTKGIWVLASDHWFTVLRLYSTSPFARLLSLLMRTWKCPGFSFPSK